jgi:esterase/lipase
MKKIILISCGKRKLDHKAKTGDLYISPLFKMSLAFARSLKPDKIFIISANYGLLSLNQEIEPYNKTLNEMSNAEIKSWAQKVREQMQSSIDFEKDEIIFLAGERYRKYLIPFCSNASVPLKGLGIGKQLKYLKDKISHEKLL